MLRQHKFLVLALVLLVVGLVAVMPAWADEAKGKIKSVDKDNARVVVTVDAKDLTLKVKDGCKITVDGEKAALADLRADQRVTVTYTVEDEQCLAEEIAAEKADG